MNPITLGEIRRAAGAELIGGEPDTVIAMIGTDGKKMQERSLFVALRGEKFDGHDFLSQAKAGGATAAMVDHIPAENGLPILRVADTRKALGQLAAFVRAKFTGKVIGVAGSNGKTGTKHLVHAALGGGNVNSGGRLTGTISPKSFNNDIGVPLSIFPADPNHDYLVLEIGTNHPGEIRNLAHIARPDIAILTNCAEEHLEGLGDVAGVRRENASIMEGMPADGVLIVHGDDAELLAAVDGFAGRGITFGFSADVDLAASDVECGLDGTTFSVNGGSDRWFVPMLGRHAACNALAAIAVGREMGLEDSVIAANLRSARGPEMRLELQERGGVTLLNDAYNANPASMRAALQTVAALRFAGRRILVLGDMRELGETSRMYHREIGRLAAAARPDWLVCVGAEAQAIAREATATGLANSRVSEFPDAATAAAEVPGRLRAGDMVLLKASRGIGLEAVAKAIDKRCEGLKRYERNV